jgi:cell division protein FtsB
MSERDFRAEAIKIAAGVCAGDFRLIHALLTARGDNIYKCAVENTEWRLQAEAALEELKAENTRLKRQVASFDTSWS